MASAQQAARITDPVTHGLGMLGIIGGMLIGAVAAAILIVSLPVSAPALVVGITAAAAVGAVAGGGLAGHQLLEGIQRACSLPSPATGMIGVTGSPNVRVGNLLAARVVADMAVPCNGLFSVNHLPIPPLPPAPIAEGAETVRINNFLAARVTSKVVCGASIKQGSLTVYYGGPTKRLLAVFDLEEMMMSVLGFLAKASLIAIAIMTIPLGLGAMATFAAVVGGFMAVNYGLGVLGDKIGPGWKDILQGGFSLASTVAGAKIGADSLAKSGVTDVPPEEPSGQKLLTGPKEPTAQEQAEDLPGHGHARHGSQTTIPEQTTRAQTGIAPDGQMAKTTRATRFDSPEAELDAVSRAQDRTDSRVANGQQSTAIEVAPDGTARLPRDQSVVTGYPGGYGSGVEVMRDPVTNQPLPGRPVAPTGQDPNALVVLQYDPATGTWQPLTQYPTNKPPTP